MYTNKPCFIFDLDGTLTDPGIGIRACVAYALESYGIIETDEEKLNRFIGPPLIEAFMKYYGVSKELADKMLIKYRERFVDKGIFENRLYDGIDVLLKTLKENGYTVALATSKPEPFAIRVIEHFGIDKYFDAVAGADLDEISTSKLDVLNIALERLLSVGISKENTPIYMIGDRHFDLNAGNALGLYTIGAVYGYGSEEELSACNPTYLANSVSCLQSLLLSL